MKLTFTNYKHYKTLFAVDRELIQGSLAACEPLVVEARKALDGVTDN